MKRRILVIVGILIIVLLLFFADLEELREYFGRISLWQWGLMLVLQSFSLFLLSFQLHKVLEVMEVKSSYRKILGVYTTGTFVESITPSVKAGGEATKVYLIHRKMGIPISVGTAAVTLQKSLSFLTFFVLAGIAILVFLVNQGIGDELGKVLLGVFLGLVALLLLILWALFFSNIGHVVKRLPLKEERRTKLLRGAETFRTSLSLAFAQKKAMGFHLLLSFSIWALFPLKAYLVSLFLGLGMTFPEVSVVTYLTYMVGLLPLLPGGLGTFEGSMVLILAPFGIRTTLGVTFAIVLRMVTFWIPLTITGTYVSIDNLLHKRRSGELGSKDR